MKIREKIAIAKQKAGEKVLRSETKALLRRKPNLRVAEILEKFGYSYDTGGNANRQIIAKTIRNFNKKKL